MGQETVAEEEAFDVVARIPSGVQLDDIAERGQYAGIKPETLDALLNALRNVPHVQIGKAVSRARADAAKALYERAGLSIVITPVLSLEAKKHDEHIACPACRERVLLTEHRQCPNCGVFVDKFTDEYQQMLREAELERAAKRKELENEFQAKLDAAVYERLKKHGVFKGKAGAARGVALVTFLGVAFIAGRATLAGWNVESLLAAEGRQARSEQLLEKAWPGQSAGGGKHDASTAPAPAAALDADLDDPLIQQAGGSRVGAKGISIEQAVAASRVLARSVGNNVADRALDDASGADGQGSADPREQPVSTASVAQVLAPAPQSGGSESTALGVAQAAVPPAMPAPAPVAVPDALKVSMAIDLSRELAELGQVGRATKVAASLAHRVQAQPGLSGQAQAANIEIRAWALGAMDPARAGPLTQQLLADAAAIADVPARVAALTQAAVALAHQSQLPREAARAFIARAGESLSAIESIDQREQAAASWAGGMGMVILGESMVAARAGRWAQVKASTSHLQGLAQQAPTAAQPRLFGILSQLQAMTGNSAAANASIDAALAQAKNVTTLAARAAMLRAIASGAGTLGEKLSGAADVLQSQLQSGAGSSADRAQAYMELSLMNAENGVRTKAAELAQAARQVPGLPSAESAALEAQLIVRTDAIGARLLHSVGLYGEAESLLRKVGGYVL